MRPAASGNQCFHLFSKIVLAAPGAERQGFIANLQRLLQVFYGVLRPDIHAAVAAKTSVLRASRLHDHLADGLDKVTNAHARRAQVCTQIARQAEPDPLVLQRLYAQHSPFDHAARRDSIRKVCENLPHRADRDTLATPYTKKEPVFVCKLLYHS